MARSRKAPPALDTLMFSSPEQRVLRFLLSEPTTSFSPRVISSRLKGIRGLGGTEGIMRILDEFEVLGLVAWIDNRRSIRLQDDSPIVQLFKKVAAVCDLESLKGLLQPISNRGILYGSRAEGTNPSEGPYDICVVSELPEEVRKVTARHPLSKHLQVMALTPAAYRTVDQEPMMRDKLSRGIVVWASN